MSCTAARTHLHRTELPRAAVLRAHTVILCAAFAAAFCGLFASCRAAAVPPRTEQVLGTLCTVNAYEDGTAALYDELFARLQEIDRHFNVNREDSDVSRINAAAGDGTMVSVHADVQAVLDRALSFAQASGGAFDPSIGPLVRLWGINTDTARVPAAGEIAAVLPLVCYSDVELGTGNTVRLKRRGMQLDLGGIAKGYAADALTEILQAHGVRQAVVNLGGNVYVWGKKKDGSSWKVGIKNPRDPDGEPLLLFSSAGSMSLVTSGVYERYFEQDGVRYHHILDAAAGCPAQRDWLSTSIVSASSMDADALSTVAFLLGPERYFAMPGHQPAVFIMADGTVIASAELNGSLSWYRNQGNAAIQFR